MLKLVFCAAALAACATTASASVTFDPLSGTGFVGKGDVQLTFGWNNAVLQRNVDGIEFRSSRTVTIDITWTCDQNAGDATQERQRTRTTTRQRLLDSTGRLRTQITGFNLLGYAPVEPTVVTDVEGPFPGSCPFGYTAIDQQTQVDPGTPIIQVESTGPNPMPWADIVQPAP
jgi:hypothetical protein